MFFPFIYYAMEDTIPLGYLALVVATWGGGGLAFLGTLMSPDD